MEKRGLLSAAVLLWRAEQTDGPRRIDADEIQGLSGMLSKQYPAGLGRGMSPVRERSVQTARFIYLENNFKENIIE